MSGKAKRAAGQRKLSILAGLYEEGSTSSPGSKAFSELEDTDPVRYPLM